MPVSITITGENVELFFAELKSFVERHSTTVAKPADVKAFREAVAPPAPPMPEQEIEQRVDSGELIIFKADGSVGRAVSSVAEAFDVFKAIVKDAPDVATMNAILLANKEGGTLKHLGEAQQKELLGMIAAKVAAASETATPTEKPKRTRKPKETTADAEPKAPKPPKEKTDAEKLAELTGETPVQPVEIPSDPAQLKEAVLQLFKKYVEKDGIGFAGAAKILKKYEAAKLSDVKADRLSELFTELTSLIKG